MFFSAQSSIALLPLSLLVYWSTAPHLRPFALCCVGALFLVIQAPDSFVVVGILTLLTYAFGVGLRRHPSRWLLVVSIAAVLAMFVITRYSVSLIAAFGPLFPHGTRFHALLVPIGISFFTFGFIHYLVDSYRGTVAAHPLTDFLAFAFFPSTLVSGPIKRFQKFQECIASSRLTAPLIWNAFCFILIGYMQKYVIADPLAVFTQPLEHPAGIVSSSAAAAGLFLYSLRIYADFAALSNIAIGSSLLFGIVVPQNFNHPYFSVSIADFWRRWHMSLGAWIREYLYIPLGGNRVGVARLCLNLIVIMTLVGIWHGPSFNFLVWGLWHGLGMAIHRLWRLYRPKAAFFDSAAFRYASIFLTFVFVTIGWAFFVTSSLDDSILILSKIFHFRFV